jgi:fused signal recognition particle receptor
MTDAADKAKEPQASKGGFFSRLKEGLLKTRSVLAGGLENIVHGTAKVGPELLAELEELLLSGDVGIPTCRVVLEVLKKEVAENRIRTREEVVERLKELLACILEANRKPMRVPAEPPFVVLVVGINGSGKTTTIGKLAKKWTDEGRRVVLAAGDTFRAAAVEQLAAWAERIGVPCIRQKSGADPSAVAFDAIQSAKARQSDIVIVDTAGRLQTNTNLMEELKKVKRVIGKVLPGAPHETLLVLDASIGQNSISQAKLFHEALAIDGLVMTKLDGTSKGGVLFNISRELGLPVRFIGIGEQADELQEFDPREFVRALFEK